MAGRISATHNIQYNMSNTGTNIIIELNQHFSKCSLINIVWQRIKSFTDSPEAIPSQTSIAVWSLLSSPVQVWVWQLFKPQRVHLPFASLPPFLPSYPLSAQNTQSTVILRRSGSIVPRSFSLSNTPLGPLRKRTEVWFHSQHTFQILVAPPPPPPVAGTGREKEEESQK